MGKRALAGGLMIAAVGLGLGTTRAEESSQPASVSVILNQSAHQVESREKAFAEAIRRDALAPAPGPFDDWELQPSGAMRNRRTGLTMIVRNPCPPGDIEHDLALAAYNRALAKARR